MATKIAVEVDVKTKDAAAEIDDLKQQMEELKKVTGDLQKKMEGGFKAAEKGAEGASKSTEKFSKKLIETGKAVAKMAVAFIVFEKLAELLQSNQRITDGLSKAMVFLQVIFGNVASAVQDLVDGLQDMKNLNIADIAQKFRDFGNALLHGADGALAQADSIVKMRNELELAEAQQRKFMLEMQNQAEIQRQIRDNIELDIETRMKANDAIAEILEAQTRGELKISALRISLREAELAMNRESIPAQAALIDAQAEQADVLERINGIYSEQKTNAAALRAEEKELFDQRNEASIQAEIFTLEGLYGEQYASFYQQRIDLDNEYAEHQQALREFLKANNEGITEDQIQSNARMIALQQAYAAKQISLAELEAETVKSAKILAAQSTANALGQIAGFLEQQGEEGVAAAKAFAVAELAINTAVAISTAIAGATQAASAGGPAAPFLQVMYIASMVGSVVAAMVQATQILDTAPGPSAGTVSASAPSAPSVAPVTTNTTELVNAEAAQLAPVQAFVVESQLSGSQENIQQIQNQATFGLTG